MRVCLDLSALPYGTGVSRYTANLAKALAVQMAPPDTLTVFGAALRQFPALKRQGTALKPAAVYFYPVPPKISSVVFNQTNLPIDGLIGAADVFHSWDWYLPAGKHTATVITVHDVALFKYPDIAHPEIKAHHHLVMQRIRQFKPQVIAVSESTKADIIELFNLDPDRVTVVYEALPEELKIPTDTAVLTELKHKYGINRPYLLMVGTLEPRKNYPRQIEAWRHYHRDCDLVIVGKEGWQTIEPEPGIIRIGYAEAAELAHLYSGAEALLYCSLSEGFGLPILEAAYHHCPVITSNCSSMKEIADSEPGVLLADPADVDEISRAIGQVIDSQSLKQQIQTATFTDRFSWDQAAAQTLEVYRTAKI